MSSELIMCGGSVRSILLLSIVARCIETVDVCIWRMLGLMSVVVSVRVRGCAVPKRYINVCNSDEFSVVNMLYTWVPTVRGCVFGRF